MKIAIPSVSKISFVNIAEILRCQSEDGYTRLFLRNGMCILSTKPLKEYDTLLSANGFYRIHRCHLINLRWVKEYHKNEADSVVLEDGTSIQLSRKKRSDFLRAMSDSFLLNQRRKDGI